MGFELFRKPLKQFKGDNCELCGSTENLIVHHVRPVAFGGRAEESNLETLCVNCHKEVHETIKIPRKPKAVVYDFSGKKVIANNPAGLRRIGVNVEKIKWDLDMKRKRKMPNVVRYEEGSL